MSTAHFTARRTEDHAYRRDDRFSVVRPGPNHRVHGDAGDHQPIARPGTVCVGNHGLSPVLDGNGTGVGKVGRSVWTQAGAAGRNRPVSFGFMAVGARWRVWNIAAVGRGHGATHRVPRHSRIGRRRAIYDGIRDHRRSVSAARARQICRLVRRGLRPRQRGRPAAGRLLHRPWDGNHRRSHGRRLAMGVLPESADGPDRAVHGHCQDAEAVARRQGKH